jgi:hypothetical protein
MYSPLDHRASTSGVKRKPFMIHWTLNPTIVLPLKQGLGRHQETAQILCSLKLSIKARSGQDLMGELVHLGCSIQVR